MLFLCDMKRILILLAFLLTGSLQAQRVLVAGTSIDYGLKASHPDSGWVPRVKVALGWQIVNKAVPNATYLDSTNYKLIPQLRSQKGQHFDIVILGGPTNDAQLPYGGGKKVPRAYQRVIDSVKLWWPDALIIHNTPIASRHPLIPQRTLDTLITPMVVAQGGLICNFAQLPSIILSPDRIHPDDWGYARMASAFVAWWRGKRDVVIKERDPIEAPIVELRVGSRMIRKQVY
jgi:lysophospholipase L1-like esterase